MTREKSRLVKAVQAGSSIAVGRERAPRLERDGDTGGMAKAGACLLTQRLDARKIALIVRQ